MTALTAWKNLDSKARIGLLIGGAFIALGVGIATASLAAGPDTTAVAAPTQSAPRTGGAPVMPIPVVTPTPTPTPSADAAPSDDAAGPVALGTLTPDAQAQADAAAQAAVLAVVTQPPGETSRARRDRLAPLFAPGSPTPDAPPAVTDDMTGIPGLSGLQVTPGLVQWSEGFDPGQGRLGWLVSVQAVATGAADGGATAWQDVSTQLWRVVSEPSGTVWVPVVAYPADQAPPVP